MNKYTIEKRDKELVGKFRAVAASKKRRKNMARLRLFGVLLAIVCAGVIVFSKNFSQSPVPEKMMNLSNRIDLNRTGDDSMPRQKAEGLQDAAVEEIELTADYQDINSHPPLKGEQVAEPVIPEKEVRPASVHVLKPRVKTSGKIGISDISEQISTKTDIQIAEIVICQSVKSRRAVSPNNKFSLKEGANPFVWMDVRSKKTPYKLRHVYYLNGRPYCSVPLAINYPRMRTWSNVTLRHQYETGQWRVDVATTSGEVLSQVKFTVVP